MKAKPKHLDIIFNEDDSVGAHPNLVVKDGKSNTTGFTITHDGKNKQTCKLPITKEDIDKKFIVDDKRKSYLTTHSNILDSNKKYDIKGRAKESLLTRFIQYLQTLLK